MSSAAVSPRRPALHPAGKLLVVFFLLGAVAIVTQSLLIREFLVLCFGNELSWGLTFFGWLVGIALGAAVGGALSRLERARLALFCIFSLLLVAVTPLEVIAVRAARNLFIVSPGEYLGLWTMIWLNPLLTIPVSFFIGAAFPLAASLVSGDEASARPIANVYAVESAGSLVGGALFSFVLIERVEPFFMLLASATLMLIALSWLAAESRRWSWGLWGLAAGCLALAVFWGDALDAWSSKLRWESFQTGAALVPPGSVDSRYENIALGRRQGQYALFLDGRLAMSFPNPGELAQTAHFVMCEAKETRHVLVIGGGLEGILSEMLKYPAIERLDYVVLDPLAVDLTRRRLAPADQAALSDPRVRVRYDDGRHFLGRLTAEERKTGVGAYDLIFLDMPEPASILLNRFYTRECFKLVERRLAPAGLFAFSLTCSTSYRSETMREYLGSVWKSLELFERRMATWGDRTFMLASPAAGVFTADGDELSRRYTSRRVRSENFNPAWFEGGSEMLQGDKVALLRKELDGSRADANTDFLPVAYRSYLVLWDQIVSGREDSSFLYLTRVSLWKTLACSAGLLVLWLVFAAWPLRRTVAEAATLWSVATTGFATMGLELILLVAFQCLYGYVYVRVGIIVGVFMLGLVVGSLLMRREIRKHPELGLDTLAGVDFVMVVFAVALPGIIHTLGLAAGRSAALPAVEWVVMTLVFVTGFLGGAIFPLSAQIVLKEKRRTGRAAGSINAADHLGACLGALVAGVVLVPALGIPATCVLIAAVKLISSLLLGATHLLRRRTSAAGA
jgi:spermidine synthase